MEFSHESVLLNECLDYLDIKNDGIYMDCTLGGAGHAQEILKRLEGNSVLMGMDQDIEALDISKKRLEKLKENLKSDTELHFENKNFKFMKAFCEKIRISNINGILMDIGVSSYQLDNASRGFSYMNDANLDMRMDNNQQLTAYEVVNNYSEEDLYKIIKDYGEEKWASRIVNFISKQRKNTEIKTTFELVEVIKGAIPSSARRDGPHPAKRTFQAIRIEVNKELEVLKDAIHNAMDVLAVGGRLCIITFHSLEDRIVKQEFLKLDKRCSCPKGFPICICDANNPVAKIITRKPVIPTYNEIENNPRSRSAKLRVIEKL